MKQHRVPLFDYFALLFLLTFGPIGEVRVGSYCVRTHWRGESGVILCYSKLDNLYIADTSL